MKWDSGPRSKLLIKISDGVKAEGNEAVAAHINDAAAKISELSAALVEACSIGISTIIARCPDRTPYLEEKLGRLSELANLADGQARGEDDERDT